MRVGDEIDVTACLFLDDMELKSAWFLLFHVSAAL